MVFYTIGYDSNRDNGFVMDLPKGFSHLTLLITKSKATFKIGGKFVNVDKNAIVIYDIGEPVFFKQRDEEFLYDWVHFNFENAEEEKKFNEISKFRQIPHNKLIFVDETNKISHIIKHMSQELLLDGLYKNEILKSYLQILFLEINELIQTPASIKSPHYLLLNKFRHELYEHPEQDWTVKICAEKYGMSESYLQHIYKEEFGTTIIADLINSRIEKAEYFLSTTALPINQIASIVGYQDSCYFSRQFKALKNISPKEYRLYNQTKEIDSHAHFKQRFRKK